jgi:hypothetical protein
MTRATLDGGLEEVRPSLDHDLEFEVATDCLMLGRTLLGQQVQDVLATVGYLRSMRPAGAASLGIVAVGPMSCLRALFAAALEPSIDSLWLDGWPVSFRDIALATRPALPMTAYLFGVVGRFELDDVLDGLGSRRVTISRPIDGDGKPVDPRRMRRAGVRGIAAAETDGRLRLLPDVDRAAWDAWAASRHA